MGRKKGSKNRIYSERIHPKRTESQDPAWKPTSPLIRSSHLARGRKKLIKLNDRIDQIKKSYNQSNDEFQPQESSMLEEAVSSSKPQPLDIRQIVLLSNDKLLECFAEPHSMESLRTYEYQCCFLPNFCDAIFKSLGNSRRAQVGMTYHLLQHVYETLVKSRDDPSFQFFAFTVEMRRRMGVVNHEERRETTRPIIGRRGGMRVYRRSGHADRNSRGSGDESHGSSDENSCDASGSATGTKSAQSKQEFEKSSSNPYGISSVSMLYSDDSNSCDKSETFCDRDNNNVSDDFFDKYPDHAYVVTKKNFGNWRLVPTGLVENSVAEDISCPKSKSEQKNGSTFRSNGENDQEICDVSTKKSGNKLHNNERIQECVSGTSNDNETDIVTRFSNNTGDINGEKLKTDQNKSHLVNDVPVMCVDNTNNNVLEADEKKSELGVTDKLSAEPVFDKNFACKLNGYDVSGSENKNEFDMNSKSQACYNSKSDSNIISDAPKSFEDENLDSDLDSSITQIIDLFPSVQSETENANTAMDYNSRLISDMIMRNDACDTQAGDVSSVDNLSLNADDLSLSTSSCDTSSDEEGPEKRRQLDYHRVHPEDYLAAWDDISVEKFNKKLLYSVCGSLDPNHLIIPMIRVPVLCCKKSRRIKVEPLDELIDWSNFPQRTFGGGAYEEEIRSSGDIIPYFSDSSSDAEIISSFEESDDELNLADNETEEISEASRENRKQTLDTNNQTKEDKPYDLRATKGHYFGKKSYTKSGYLPKSLKAMFRAEEKKLLARKFAKKNAELLGKSRKSLPVTTSLKSARKAQLEQLYKKSVQRKISSESVNSVSRPAPTNLSVPPEDMDVVEISDVPVIISKPNLQNEKSKSPSVVNPSNLLLDEVNLLDGNLSEVISSIIDGDDQIVDSTSSHNSVEPVSAGSATSLIDSITGHGFSSNSMSDFDLSIVKLEPTELEPMELEAIEPLMEVEVGSDGTAKVKSEPTEEVWKYGRKLIQGGRQRLFKKRKAGTYMVNTVSLQERMEALRCIRDLKTQPDTSVVCRICHKSFSASSVLLQHYHSHAGIKPYQCNLCGSTFTRQHSLNYHMLIHNNLNRFKCEECGRLFRHPSHYKDHMRRHAGELPYVCTVCQVGFKSRNTYKRHMRMMHDVDTPSLRSMRHDDSNSFNDVYSENRDEEPLPGHTMIRKRFGFNQIPPPIMDPNYRGIQLRQRSTAGEGVNNAAVPSNSDAQSLGGANGEQYSILSNKYNQYNPATKINLIRMPPRNVGFPNISVGPKPDAPVSNATPMLGRPGMKSILRIQSGRYTLLSCPSTDDNNHNNDTAQVEQENLSYDKDDVLVIDDQPVVDDVVGLEGTGESELMNATELTELRDDEELAELSQLIDFTNAAAADVENLTGNAGSGMAYLELANGSIVNTLCDGKNAVATGPAKQPIASATASVAKPSPAAFAAASKPTPPAAAARPSPAAAAAKPSPAAAAAKPSPAAAAAKPSPAAAVGQKSMVSILKCFTPTQEISGDNTSMHSTTDTQNNESPSASQSNNLTSSSNKVTVKHENSSLGFKLLEKALTVSTTSVASGSVLNSSQASNNNKSVTVAFPNKPSTSSANTVRAALRNVRSFEIPDPIFTPSPVTSIRPVQSSAPRITLSRPVAPLSQSSTVTVSSLIKRLTEQISQPNNIQTTEGQTARVNTASPVLGINSTVLTTPTINILNHYQSSMTTIQVPEKDDLRQIRFTANRPQAPVSVLQPITLQLRPSQANQVNAFSNLNNSNSGGVQFIGLTGQNTANGIRIVKAAPGVSSHLVTSGQVSQQPQISGNVNIIGGAQSIVRSVLQSTVPSQPIVIQVPRAALVAPRLAIQLPQATVLRAIKPKLAPAVPSQPVNRSVIVRPHIGLTPAHSQVTTLQTGPAAPSPVRYQISTLLNSGIGSISLAKSINTQMPQVRATTLDKVRPFADPGVKQMQNFRVAGQRLPLGTNSGEVQINPVQTGSAQPQQYFDPVITGSEVVVDDTANMEVIDEVMIDEELVEVLN